MLYEFSFQHEEDRRLDKKYGPLPVPELRKYKRLLNLI
jgi:hypothetical protein